MARIRTTGTNFVARNLRYLLQQRQMTQGGLAKATGLKQPTINRIVLGRNVRPLDKTIAAIARFFDVSADDLRFKNLSDQSGLPYNLRGFRIPLVSAEVAGTMTIERRHWNDTVSVEYEVSEKAFMMIVADDGMSPRINREDRVLVEDIFPQPNQVVAARVEGAKTAIVRRYRTGSYTEAKRDFELVPENPNFPKITSREVKISILGVVIERRERIQ